MTQCDVHVWTAKVYSDVRAKAACCILFALSLITNVAHVCLAFKFLLKVPNTPNFLTYRAVDIKRGRGFTSISGSDLPSAPSHVTGVAKIVKSTQADTAQRQTALVDLWL